MANLLKLTAGTVVTLSALYAATGYLAVPAIVKSVLADQIEQNLHREMTVENVSFDPWNWTLTIQGLRVNGDSPDSALLALNELSVDISSETLQHMAPVVDHLHIDGLHVLASLDDPTIRKLTIENSEEPSEPQQTESSDKSEGGIPNFAVYDIAVKDSSIRVTDKARALNQSVTDINISLPFISTIARDKDSAVTPALSFNINGTPIVAKGKTTPFGDSQETQLNVKIDGLEIAQFARLLPALNSPAMKLESGRFSTDLSLIFRNPSPDNQGKTLLSGTASLKQIKATQKIGMKVENLLAVDAVELSLRELDLLDKEAHIQNLLVKKPSVNLVRTPRAVGPISTRSEASKEVSSSQSQPANDWRWSLDNFQIQNGSVRWLDQTVRPKASLQITRLNAKVSDLDSQSEKKTAKLHVDATLLGGSFAADGTISAKQKLVTVSLNGKSLNTQQVAPYIRDLSGLDLSGSLGFNVNGRLQDGNFTGKGSLNTTGIALKDAGAPLVSAASASVSVKNIDLQQRQIDIDRVTLKKADIAVEKNRQGINLLTLGQKGQPGSSGKASPAETPETPAEAPWQWSLGQLSIENSRVSFRDTTVTPAVATELNNIRANVSNLASSGKTPGKINVSAQLANGTLASQGTLLMAPLTVDLQTDISRVSMDKLSPVLVAYTGIGAKSGQLNTQGRLSIQNDVTAWAGNINFQNFDIRNKNGTSLMLWKNASLNGLDVRTTDPLYLVIESAVIEQPGTKQTQTVREIAGLAGALAALSGNSKTAQKIEKFEGKMDRNLVLNDIRYVNGRFTANGVTPESLAGLLLNKLSQSMHFGQTETPSTNTGK